MSEYITIASDAYSPSDFHTQFNTTFNLTEDYEVALKSIFYGPLCNVCEHNDLLVLRLNNREMRELRVSHGYYPTMYYLTRAINDTVVNFYDNLGEGDENWAVSNATNVKFNSSQKQTGGISAISLSLPENVKFYYYPFTHGKSNILDLYGVQLRFSTSKLLVRDTKLEYKHQVGFVYSSLVKDSKFNNKDSRLLATIPLYTDDGYSEYMVVNPSYYPIAVTSFDNVSFQIRDNKGKLVEIAHRELADRRENKPILYPTILTLHIRKRL